MRSKLITESTQINDAKISILGFILYPDGSNAPTLVLYNEADDSETDAQRVAACRGLATVSKEVRFPKPLYCSKGLYATLSGDNAIAFILLE